MYGVPQKSLCTSSRKPVLSCVAIYHISLLSTKINEKYPSQSNKSREQYKLCFD